MPAVVAFDVNETLLDLRALDPVFDDVMGDSSLRPQWFATMLMLALTGAITGRYVDFTQAQHAALRMVAERSSVPVEQTWLVAAHAWDVSGALAAGCRAAFVSRPGMVPSAVDPQPDLIVADIAALAERLPAAIA